MKFSQNQILSKIIFKIVSVDSFPRVLKILFFFTFSKIISSRTEIANRLTESISAALPKF